MNNYLFKLTICALFLVADIHLAVSQEIGANFNHDPEIIDLGYLKKTPVEWIRTTPYIFEYIDGKKDPATDAGLGKIIEAKQAGYKVAFGFRWDFKKFSIHIPEPGSETEKKYFSTVTAMLTRLDGKIDILKLGNEVNLETMDDDLNLNSKGYIPLVNFMERLLDVVILPYYSAHPQYKKPAIYIGSFPALFEPKQQKIPGVIELIKFAQNNKNITGLSIHLHIADTLEIEKAFKFVRSIMPRKPIIVPEFSLFRLYNKHLSDSLGDSWAGKAFAKKYGYSNSMKLYEWFSNANTKKISAEEFSEMFATRKWFYPHAMETFYRYFHKNGVVLATYGFFSQAAPTNVRPNTPIWFINPIFAGKTLRPHPDGSFMENPLWFHDFVDIINKGKTTRMASHD